MSPGGSVLVSPDSARPDPAGTGGWRRVERGAWGVGRGNSGLWSVPREAEGRELAVRGKR